MQKYLDECFDLVKKIKKVDGQIEEIKSANMSPKNQVITDMPKGGNNQLNKLEKYIIKLERLEAKKNYLCVSLNHNWTLAKMKLSRLETIPNGAYLMLKLRYYHGYPWKKCAIKMKEAYPNDNWNENKCFRVHYSILHKTEH